MDPIATDSTAFADIDSLTPAMRQFAEVKLRYPGTLVLFRMGDFYETFFDDAGKANRLIGITLTKRGKLADGTPIPMAGIPAVSLDGYIARLVKMGESVVIVEQQGEPGKAATMVRKISRIITPGTLTETSLLPEKEDAVLLALEPPAKKDGAWGFVWLTLSNGDFRASEVPAPSFAGEVARINPSEILAPEKIARQLRSDLPGRTVTPLPAWHFDAEHGEAALKKLFSVETLDAWDLKDRTAILAAANALLDYTAETQVDMMPFIAPIVVERESEFVVIDPASRRNLEISESIRRDADAVTLFSVLDGCGTSMGSRELRRRLHQPLRDAALARRRHDEIGAFVENEALRRDMLDAFRRVPDIERITSRIALGSVRPRELASLRDAIPVAMELSEKLKASGEPGLGQLAAELQPDPSIYERLSKALLDEPAVNLRDGDVIRGGYDEELDQLRTLRDNTGQFLIDLETRERAATGIQTLRVEYNKVHGFYIEVTKAQAGNVPVHYHRRQTLKNTERYITPELKDYEDKALSAKERSSALERSLYDDVVGMLQPKSAELMAFAHALAALDVAAALAEHAASRGWVRPELTAKTGIRIEAGRHPVIETMVETYVPNDCELKDGRRMLVITGPNMGGKSTYMRSVALIVLLAWAGSFVPAASAQIGPVDRIHTRIGASDDLSRGQSTFMVEMTEAAAILHQATPQSLVLMDEIGRGTSTYDGLSLAGAIAQALVEETRSLTLFATHYFELTSLAESLREVANVHVSATQSKSRIVFLHEIAEGPANRSYGIAVAKLAGIPAHVVRRARTFLTKLENAGSAGAPQPGLFTDGFWAPEDVAADILPEVEELPPEADPSMRLAEKLADLDVDNLSPRDALAMLFELSHEAGRIFGRDQD